MVPMTINCVQNQLLYQCQANYVYLNSSSPSSHA